MKTLKFAPTIVTLFLSIYLGWVFYWQPLVIFKANIISPIPVEVTNIKYKSIRKGMNSPFAISFSVAEPVFKDIVKKSGLLPFPTSNYVDKDLNYTYELARKEIGDVFTMCETGPDKFNLHYKKSIYNERTTSVTIMAYGNACAYMFKLGF